MAKYFQDNLDAEKIADIVESNTIEGIKIPNRVLFGETKDTGGSLSNSQKNVIEEMYVDTILTKHNEATAMVEKYSEETKTRIKNEFEKFAPIELFGKINQLIFVVADLANRITQLEDVIKTSKNLEQPQNTTDTVVDGIDKRVSPPAKTQKSIEHPSIHETQRLMDTVRERLNNAKSGNPVPRIPIDGLQQSDTKLEEIFPNLDDDAYEAAYAAIAQNKPKVQTQTEKPSPGNMRGMHGF